jgi:hypothetical protein
VTLSREQFIRDAWSIEGRPFLHQGRDPFAGGIDCLHVVPYLLGLQGYQLPIDIPNTYQSDSHDYKLIEATLEAHLQRITKEDARAGDIYLFRPSLKMRHLGVRLNDVERPLLLHASSQPEPDYPTGRVSAQPFSDRWLVMYRASYRIPALWEGECSIS